VRAAIMGALGREPGEPPPTAPAAPGPAP
jgi:hypothetical protein